MQYARIKEYKKDPHTGDIILIASPTDETGKPIYVTPEGGENIQVRLSQDGLQKLIREELPTEEKRIQEVLDKIHEIRIKRSLNLDAIDKAIETLTTNADTAFDGCQNKTDISKVRSMFLTKIALMSQKRFITKFAIQEESELSLQLAKLRQSTQSE